MGSTLLDEFSMQRFLNVLTWATAGVPHLRLLMAECEQIYCRGTERFLMDVRSEVRETGGASALDAMSRGEQRRLGCRQLMSFCHLVRIVGLANGAEPRAGEGQSVLRALTHASDTLMGRRGLGASSSCPTTVEFWA